MAIPTVDRCGCLTLSAGGILIGVGSFVGHLIALCLLYESTMRQMDYSWWRIVLAVLLCMIMLASIAWIYGIVKRTASPMVPLFTYSSIGVIILLILPFASLAYFSSNNIDPLTGVPIFILLGVFAAFICYIWVIENSLFEKVKRAPKKTKAVPEKQPAPSYQRRLSNPRKMMMAYRPTRFYMRNNNFYPETSDIAFIEAVDFQAGMNFTDLSPERCNIIFVETESDRNYEPSSNCTLETDTSAPDCNPDTELHAPTDSFSCDTVDYSADCSADGLE